MPDTSETENDRFNRLAKAILSVPKSEVPTVKKAVAHLNGDKRKIDAQPKAVQQEIAKRIRRSPQAKLIDSGLNETVEEHDLRSQIRSLSFSESSRPPPRTKLITKLAR